MLEGPQTCPGEARIASLEVVLLALGERDNYRGTEKKSQRSERPGSSQRCFTLGTESRVGTQGQAPGQHIQHAGLHPCYSKQNQNQREVLLGRRI